MFGWFRPKCPIALSQAVAVDRYMSRLAQVWSVARLQSADVVRPNPQFFPEPYSGSDEDADRFCKRTCSWMGVEPQRASLQWIENDGQRPPAWGVVYQPGNPAALIVSRACLDQPMKLMAALTHGFAQLLLDDAGLRLAGWRQNALAECLTVFLGLGLFPANATIEERNSRSGRVYRWSLRRQGALTEKQFGYAFGVFAWLRDEGPAAPWASDLSINVREPFRQTVNYLSKTGDCQFKAADDEAGWSMEAKAVRRIEALRSPSAGARLAALWDLGQWGPKAAAAVERLQEMLGEDDPDLRAEAADALGAVGPEAEAATPALADAAIQDHDRGLRRAAAGALGCIAQRPEAALPALMYLLKSDVPPDRVVAVWALGRFGSAAAGAVSALTDLLTDGDSALAAEAAYALGAIGGVAVVALPDLIQALRRGEGDLPAGAAYALGCMGAAAAGQAVPALRKAQRHMDPIVAEAAADALAALGFGDLQAHGAGDRPLTAKGVQEVYRLDPRFRQA